MEIRCRLAARRDAEGQVLRGRTPAAWPFLVCVGPVCSPAAASPRKPHDSPSERLQVLIAFDFPRVGIRNSRRGPILALSEMPEGTIRARARYELEDEADDG